jgi:hypothetical protein
MLETAAGTLVPDVIRRGGRQSRGPAERLRRPPGFQRGDRLSHGVGTFVGPEMGAAGPLEDPPLESGQHVLEMLGIGGGIAADEVGLGVNLASQAGPGGGVGAGR